MKLIKMLSAIPAGVIHAWNRCDWVERAMFFGVPALVVILISVGIYVDNRQWRACEEAAGSYEKDGTHTMIMVKVGDVYVPQKIYGYHCVMPEVAVEEVAPVSTMDAYLYGE